MYEKFTDRARAVLQQAQKEAEEREAKILKEKQERSERYQVWLTDIGYSKEQADLWYFEAKDGSVYAYKYAGTFNQ